MVDVLKVAANLRAYAEHFAQGDWDYTRAHRVKKLYYEDFWSRLRDVARFALRDLIRSNKRGIMAEWRVSRWRMIKAHWRYHNHLPDGHLDGGNILTQWEETGEYLQFVQPSVGSLIADFLEAEPEHPHAQRIAAEMRRIQDRYSERLKSPVVGQIHS